MSMTLPDLSFRLSYGPSEDRRRPATFPKALGFREGANLRRREGVGGGFACLEADLAGGISAVVAAYPTPAELAAACNLPESSELSGRYQPTVAVEPVPGGAGI